jgi:hypothetical protein
VTEPHSNSVIAKIITSINGFPEKWRKEKNNLILRMPVLGEWYSLDIDTLDLRLTGENFPVAPHQKLVLRGYVDTWINNNNKKGVENDVASSGTRNAGRG